MPSAHGRRRNEAEVTGGGGGGTCSRSMVSLAAAAGSLPVSHSSPPTPDPQPPPPPGTRLSAAASRDSGLLHMRAYMRERNDWSGCPQVVCVCVCGWVGGWVGGGGGGGGGGGEVKVQSPQRVVVRVPLRRDSARLCPPHGGVVRRGAAAARDVLRNRQQVLRQHKKDKQPVHGHANALRRIKEWCRQTTASSRRGGDTDPLRAIQLRALTAIGPAAAADAAACWPLLFCRLARNRSSKLSRRLGVRAAGCPPPRRLAESCSARSRSDDGLRALPPPPPPPPPSRLGASERKKLLCWCEPAGRGDGLSESCGPPLRWRCISRARCSRGDMTELIVVSAERPGAGSIKTLPRSCVLATTEARAAAGHTSASPHHGISTPGSRPYRAGTGRCPSSIAGTSGRPSLRSLYTARTYGCRYYF